MEKKTSEFYVAFNAEINVVKKLFDAVRRMPPKSPILPKYAGTARSAAREAAAAAAAVKDGDDDDDNAVCLCAPLLDPCVACCAPAALLCNGGAVFDALRAAHFGCCAWLYHAGMPCTSFTALALRTTRPCKCGTCCPRCVY